MKVHNHLHLLVECLGRWQKCPSERQFIEEYAQPLRKTMGDFFDDFYEVLTGLDWKQYRNQALTINPAFEESRFQENLKKVEDLFGFQLEGEVFLLGTFETMDGFARFERGSHRVYLGMDESHLDGRYLDILTVHELTHVARETRPEVWEGYGLNPKMERSVYLENQSVIEHILGEGFSCAVSEILIPGEEPWKYTYQDVENLERVFQNAEALDRIIKNEILHPDGDYGSFYGIDPIFSHYVWGTEWVKKLLREHGDDPKKLVARCSKDFIDSALKFQLGKG